MSNDTDPRQDASPWWRHGHVWLVVAGPAVVVVASLVTAVLAARGADQVLDEGAARRGTRIERQAVRERAMLPALQGRNHAATPAAQP
jgi:hypothetical protein